MQSVPVWLTKRRQGSLACVQQEDVSVGAFSEKVVWTADNII